MGTFSKRIRKANLRQRVARLEMMLKIVGMSMQAQSKHVDEALKKLNEKFYKV